MLLLRIATTAVFVFMIFEVVTTSLKSNLFELMRTWDSANYMAPWFSATLWDFYANVFFIFIWVVYKEQSVWRSLLWLVLLVCLGSIATAGYFLIQLFRLKNGEGLRELFTAGSASR